MNEELTDKLKKAYDDLMVFPYKVLDIFNDFFGEERVDLQGFPSFEEFVAKLENRALGYLFPDRIAIYSSYAYSALSKEDKEKVEEAFENDALFKPVFDNIIMLPIAAERLFNECYILIHFPHVRITNEYNRGVDVNHLWVKVGITLSGAGKGMFSLNRSEYPISHMLAGYLHSHVSGIPFDNFSQFKHPCLGQGPIKNTLATLAIGYDEAMWQLFCLELDKYVKTESISGGPYKRLEQIGNLGMSVDDEPFRIGRSYGTTGLPKDYMRSFVKYLIRQEKFKFNFINGSYSFAMSYTDFMIFLSNEFIEWYNHKCSQDTSAPTYEELTALGTIRECIISKGKIHYPTNNYHSDISYFMSFEGASICTFKGKPITLHIIEAEPENINKTILINKKIAANIAKAVLEIINYKYGRKEVETGTSTRYL